MNKIIRLGIWGLGRMGQIHAEHFLKKHTKYQAASFCDSDPARAEVMALRYGGRSYTDSSAFLQDPETDLVLIVTRSLDHVRHASQALQAGKTVLLEKPIAVTEQDLADLENLVKQYPGKLYFGQNHRFEPAFAQMKEIVHAGLLGKIHTVRICKTHPFRPRCDWQMLLEHGGGQLSVWGPHVLDQMLQLLTPPVQLQWSNLQKILTPGDADDHFQLILRGADGATGEIEVSNVLALERPYCQISGDRGALMCNADQQTISLRYIEPQFQFQNLQISAETPKQDAPWGPDNIPWIQETRPVTPAGVVAAVTAVEEKMADALWMAIHQQAPFPVTSEQALDVVRMTCRIKRENPQFAWKQ